MKYSVEILKNKPFQKMAEYGEKNEIIKRNFTMEVTFYDKEGTIEEIKEYGYYTADEIKKDLNEGKEIVLNECYVHSLELNHIEIKNLFLCINTFFDGKSYFVGTMFSKHAKFVGATFGEQADFSESIFSEQADFRHVTFNKESDFRDVLFNESASFRKAIFIGKTAFLGTSFMKQAFFNEATFKEQVFFNDAIFKEHVFFNNAIIENRLLFEGNIFNENIDIRLKKCNTLIIERCIIEKTLNLQGVKFNILCLRSSKNLGQIFLDWEWDNFKIKKSIYNSKRNFKLSYYELAEQFLLLKQNYNTMAQYNYEDNAYIEFKRCEAKSKIFDQRNLFKRTINTIIYPFKWLITDLIGLYATSPQRVLIALIVNTVCFVPIYLKLGVHVKSLENGMLKDGILARTLEMIYFTVITSLGYLDVSPGRFLVAALTCINAFNGFFLMTYFTVAFTRKILR